MLATFGDVGSCSSIAAFAHYPQLALRMDKQHRVVARWLELDPARFLKPDRVVLFHPNQILIWQPRCAPSLGDRKDGLPHAPQ
jgi:hypothetical protein